MILSLKPNDRGRDFAVGDIHGHFHVLERGLVELNFDPSVDRVLAVGDLIDRGPESHRVLEFLDYPWFYSVKGNHESFLVQADEAARRGDLSVMFAWVKAGGRWSLEIDESLMDRYAYHLRGLPLIMEVPTPHGRVGICHAEPPIGCTWRELKTWLNRGSLDVQEGLLWDRHRIQAYRDHGQPECQSWSVKGIDHVITGHSTVLSWTALGNVHFIDTGIGHGMQLCVLHLNHPAGFLSHYFQ